MPRTNPLRYPLVWFVVIGVALFVADRWSTHHRETIVVDGAVRHRLATLWETQTGAPPSPEQLDSLVNNWVREEVFYREALRLDLDENDSIIRRRLIQKLDFVAEDVTEPDDATLKAWYASHRERYRLPMRYTFSQLYFSRGHDKALAGAKAALAGNPADWRKFGEPSMLGDSYASQSPTEITSAFGKAFTDKLVTILPGMWNGPIESAYGLHLVRVAARQPSKIADFDTVKQDVLNDYLTDQRRAARDRYYKKLLERYRVVRR